MVLGGVCTTADSLLSRRDPQLVPCGYLELLLVVLEGFHDHAHGLHGALQPAIHPVEAVHAAGNVYHQAQALGFLLWATQLREGIAETMVSGHPGFSRVLQCQPKVGRSAPGSGLHRAVPVGRGTTWEALPLKYPACPMSACVIGGEPTSTSLVSVAQSLEDHCLPGLKGGQPAKARPCERSLAKKVRKHFQNGSIL